MPMFACTNVGSAHNLKKSTTDYTDGKACVTRVKSFHISAIRLPAEKIFVF